MIKGDMMPMVASDGPHYGDNVKLKGPGKYKVKLIIYPHDGPVPLLAHAFLPAQPALDERELPRRSRRH